MHGVKRLFAWMIALRQDALQRLADQPAQERSVRRHAEEFGIDVTYMARHKFDPATFPALLKVLR